MCVYLCVYVGGGGGGRGGGMWCVCVCLGVGVKDNRWTLMIHVISLQ